MELGDTGIGKREKLREVNEHKEDEIRQRVVGVFFVHGQCQFRFVIFSRGLTLGGLRNLVIEDI